MSQVSLEVTPQTLQQLSVCLQATLSNDKQERRKAEDYLQSAETAPNYGLVLLTLLDSPECEMYIRVAAAVNFKNFIKRNWRIIEGETNRINDKDRESIKQLIIRLMLKNPEALQRQLSDAISIIGREDFPEKWENLLPEMIDRIQNGTIQEVSGILQTAHSLFKRFRYSFKSQELWMELKYVLDKFARPLTELFDRQMTNVSAQINDANKLKETFDVLVLICKLFYSLNYQDLPEYFEDNMKQWMTSFHSLLVGSFKVLETEDSDDAGPLEKLRSQICDNIALYAQKYDEEFQVVLNYFFVMAVILSWL